MLCFLLVPLYASTRTPSKGTCAKPLIIVSQYSTGPQHNMGCKYMLDLLGWTPLSHRRLDLFCFTKLLTVWHKCPSNASLLRRIRLLEVVLSLLDTTEYLFLDDKLLAMHSLFTPDKHQFQMHPDIIRSSPRTNTSSRCIQILFLKTHSYHWSAVLKYWE